MSERDLKLVRAARPTLEGAGVHLRRALGFGTDAETFDPLLMRDREELATAWRELDEETFVQHTTTSG
jgi:hypothetical protein